jgi:hypothetical protein
MVLRMSLDRDDLLEGQLPGGVFADAIAVKTEIRKLLVFPDSGIRGSDARTAQRVHAVNEPPKKSAANAGYA